MEDKIEVNEYVRTNKGNIGKIVEIRLGFNKDLQVYQDIYKLDNGLWTILDYIVKHSKQLMDLIEVGDYVNGYKVINIIKNKINNNKLIAVGNMDYEFETVKELTETNGIKLLGNKDIQTILTKESYMANCYKVGGEEDD
jgi:hypothetical protein